MITPLAKWLSRAMALVLVVALSGCALASYGPPAPANEAEVRQLAQAIYALDPEVVSSEEAERAARVAFAESARLARLYEIEDHPLTHNSKVNLGIKERGLCYHWADDLERRLKQERFQTLELFRAVANFQSLRLEHSTVIIGARGGQMLDGIVLDPWRKGGWLTWEPADADPRYEWIPREEVFRIRREKRERRGR